MINFKLPVPIFLKSQTDKIAEALQLDKSLVLKLAESTAAIPMEDEKGYTKGSIVTGKDATTLSHALRGGEAVSYLCGQNNLPFQALTEISIPLDVYFETNDRQWSDICSLAARVKMRCDRLQKLMKMEVPAIILWNESRMLREFVEILENNSFGEPQKWKDGTVKRALNDIGYSLVNGWDEEMQQKFNKENEKINQAFNEESEGE